MIYIQELIKKVEDIFNGNNVQEVRPIDFLFKCVSSGYFIDHIKDKESGKNFIPVFIEQAGGEYNPIPNLKQASQTYLFTVYFPVRFKEQMFTFSEYLANQFVGKYIDFGALSGKGLVNITPAEYGEIQQFDFAQFKKWVNDTYKEEIKKDEMYMAMTFRMFVTTVGASFILGNCVNYGVEFKHDETIPRIIVTDDIRVIGYDRAIDKDITEEGIVYCAWENETEQQYHKVIYTRYNIPSFEDDTYFVDMGGIEIDLDLYVKSYNGQAIIEKTYTKESLVWSQSGTGANVSPIAQQLIGTSYARNVANITNYNKSILAYVENDEMWSKLLELYNTNKLDEIKEFKLVKKYEFNDGTTKTYDYEQVILSINENSSLGSPLSFTFTFGDE